MAGGQLPPPCPRPEEVFATNSIPSKDTQGNVFVGIRKHNTYLLHLLNLCLYPDRGEAGDRHPQVELAAELLQRYSRALDPLLLRPYLRNVFQHTVTRTHAERVHCELAVANRPALGTHEVDVGLMRRRAITIDSERVCT
eukprot:gene53751-29214_t